MESRWRLRRLKMGSRSSVTKQRLQSAQLCLECLRWVEPWLVGLPRWPTKLWREQATSPLPLDLSRRIQPNNVMKPQQDRTWQSHRLIPTLLMLQRTTPMITDRELHSRRPTINNQ